MREKRGWLSEIEREAFAAGSTEMGFQIFFCLVVFKEIAAKKKNIKPIHLHGSFGQQNFFWIMKRMPLKSNFMCNVPHMYKWIRSSANLTSLL